MSRKPINGVRAMTAAERQRKRRERLGIAERERQWKMPWRDYELTMPDREREAIERLYVWMDRGDAAAVTEWLAEYLGTRMDSGAILDAVRRRIAEMEAEAIED